MDHSLRPYQEVGRDFLFEGKVRGLGDQMGLGKTAQAIKAAVKTKSKIVICVTKASLQTQWEEEIYKWTGEKATRLKTVTPTIPDKTTRFYVISYSVLYAWIPTLRSMAIDAQGTELTGTAIFDESHMIKTMRTKRTKAAMNISRLMDYVFLLSGTPMEHRPLDMVGQLAVMGFLRFLGGEKKYLERYCNPRKKRVAHGRIVTDYSGSSNKAELAARLDSIWLSRTKEEVAADLPVMSWNELIIDIDSSYLDEHNSIRQQIAIRIDAIEKEKSVQFEYRHLFDQLRLVSARGKVGFAIDWMNDLDGADQSIAWTHHVEIAESVNVSTNSALIHGGISLKKRDKIVKEFKTGQVQNLVMTIDAGKEGFNFPNAHHNLFVQLPWTPAALNQASERIHRITTTHPTFSWVLMAKGTYDINMWRALKRKEDVVQSLMGTQSKRGFNG